LKEPQVVIDTFGKNEMKKMELLEAEKEERGVGEPLIHNHAQFLESCSSPIITP
jgi:hypothetical protein